MVENISLLQYNTFSIEAKADAFIELNTADEIKKECMPVWSGFEKKLVLGGGSNLLFSSDFKGLVVKPSIKGIQIIKEDSKNAWVNVGAGEIWDDFVRFCVDKGFGGLENLSYIPGCVGAAPIQNIGAYGVEVGAFIHKVKYIDTENFEEKEKSGEDCQFGYRSSVFKHELKDRAIITHVTFKLDKKHQFVTHYGAIEEELKKQGETNISTIRNVIIDIRKDKLPEPEELGNAGSFFKNPVIEKELFEKLRKEFEDIKFFETIGGVKIPAGWLIEKAGWKGLRIGNVGMHEKQALVLVNYGGALGKDLVKHAFGVRDSVFQKFNIHLEHEVNIV